MLNEAKERYYNNKFPDCAGYSRKTWKLIDEVVNGENERNNVIQSLNINNCTVTDPQTDSNYMNKYLSCVGQDLSSKGTVRRIFLKKKRRKLKNYHVFVHALGSLW